MQVINQHTALLSLNQALVPSPSLIDGRSDQDWLSFFADVGSLINFYDSDNKINGNWAPFLLKDPAILLASISKKNVTKLHSLYMQTCIKLEQTLAINVNAKHVTNSFNQLFDQLIRLFMWLERWIYFMMKSVQEYSLKKYVIHQVQTIYSELFWAILAMREQLFIDNTIPGIHPINYYLFDSYDEQIWKQNRDKQPFWRLLQLNRTFSENTTIDLYNALKKVGDQLFLFFNNVIQHSNTTFEKIKLEKSEFPDTVLVRAFVNLLTIFRDQLNDISQKHLDFYYNDILKQEVRPAIPDEVFIAIDLGKKDMAYFLPANTLFDAGLDVSKKTIVFETKKNNSLNPAAIIAACTLTISPNNTYPTSLFLQPIVTPNRVQKDENGVIQSWPPFGNSTPVLTSATTLGFAIASPLLLLREGTRTVTLTFTFEGIADLSALHQATYFLSTATTWLNIGTLIPNIVTIPNPTIPTTNCTQATIQFTLDATQPAIEAFQENPDGYISNWPLLKMEFASFYAAIIPPVITSLSIDVTVTNVTNLQLFNDYGALSTKTSYPLFGPLPMVNSNFIIGSNEIFSKPLSALHIDLTWDKLPINFQSYYQQYNNYLVPVIKTETKTAASPAKSSAKITPAPKGFLQKSWAAIKIVGGKIGNIFKNIIGFLLKIIKGLILLVASVFTFLGRFLKKIIIGILKVIADDIEELTETPFNNFCFTIDFQVLENNTWNELPMLKQKTITISQTTNTINTIPYSINISPATNLLFSTDDLCQLTDNSYFSSSAPLSPTVASLENKATISSTITNIVSKPITTGILAGANPNIQITPLKYTDNTSSGFMKMVLTGPSPHGFGSALYPSVVANIALKNALVVANKGDKSLLIPQANLPFVPKLSNIAAHYSASQKYDFTQKGSYPIQCFAYSPFANYLVHDNAQSLPAYNYNVGDTTVSNTPTALSTLLPTIPAGLALFPSLNNYTGFLFLEMENVVATNEINFYFELARKYNKISFATKPIACYYLSATGWQPLSIIADGTNNLTCSGIITLNVQEDITKNHQVMPRNNFWISIAIQDTPDQFAHITFLKTNGVELIRSGTGYLTDTMAPQLVSNTITKPIVSTPAIANVMQPFPSFGGKPMENQLIKNGRISNRLKTKDRVVSAEDYFRTIQQAFDFIYYSKTVYLKETKTTQVYVVKSYLQTTDATAFAPLISDCQEQKIQLYLQQRASIFSTINVSNFQFQYVTISVIAEIIEGYEINGVQKNINNALNIFLSPWITSRNSQVAIDEPIYDYQIAALVSNISGIATITSVTFKSWMVDPITNAVTEKTNQQSIQPFTMGSLMVSNMDHAIVLSY